MATANSFWEQHNQRRQQDPLEYQYGQDMARPADWQQYVASGGDPMKQSSYQNWQQQNQRNTGVSNFVDQMYRPDPAQQQATAQFGQDFGDAGNRLRGYLNTSPGDMPNQFQGALGDTQNRITSLLDNPDSINQSAAYKFRFNQGMYAVNRNLAAKGLLGSGNRLAALNDYGQGQASQEYGDQFNRLSGLLGTNTQGYLGDKNANTNAWQSKGSLLGDYYGKTGGNLNQSMDNNANQRLGWGNLYTKISPQPQSWNIANSW